MNVLSIFSVFSIIILLSCNQKSNSKKENFANDSILSTEQMSVKAEVMSGDSTKSDSTFFLPDTSINSELILWNAESVYRCFGDLKNKLNSYDTASSDVYFKSNTGEQYIQLIQLPGGSPNTITTFEVGFTKNLNSRFVKLYPSPIPLFKTGKEIELGVSKDFIIDKMGNDYVEENDVIGHRIVYNHEIDGLYYTAVYHFKTGKLVKFRFGYDNP